MSGVQIKICGLTRREDVDAVVVAGADAVGFVFARSPRRLDATTASALASAVPGDVQRVGLFMNQDRGAVEAVLSTVELDLLQFHGDENNAFCRQFGLPFLKAVSMLGEGVETRFGDHPDAIGLLLDAHAPGGGGGTGQTFDWNQRIESDQPLWLAGGLNPDNVADAIRHFRPYAVDVSSGVEHAPGIKDPEKVRQFIFNARQVEA